MPKPLVIHLQRYTLKHHKTKVPYDVTYCHKPISDSTKVAVNIDQATCVMCCNRFRKKVGEK